MLHTISYKSKLIDMKRVLLILSLLICSITSSFGQRNYAQELVDLLRQGKCFEAIEFREQYANRLPLHDEAFDLLYKSHMSLFFNKPDSTIFYLEKLLGNQNYILNLGPTTGAYYGHLLRLYRDKQQYDAGVNVCDNILDYLKRNPFMFDQNFIQNETKLVQDIKFAFSYRASKEPRIKIKKNGGGEKIRLNDSEYIKFNATYNGVTIETLFDTGVSYYFFIQEDLANEIGVKNIRVEQDSIQMINGVPVRAYEAMIDSVNLGSLKLYNIPVMVFKEKFTSRLSNTLDQEFKSGAEAVFSNRQIMMGLPTMKLIGRFEFDWENRTLSFPNNNPKTVGQGNIPNIFLIQDSPYLNLKINGLNYVGYLDTGSNIFLNVIFPFYEKNKDRIQIDTLSQKTSFARHMLTGTISNIPCKVIKNINVDLGGTIVNSNDSEILVFNVFTNNVNTFDGEVGSLFLKAMGPKIIIDFDNMKIESSN